MTAATGATIGNYRILNRLGEGGMGTVYRAIDTLIEREVALKFLKPEIAAQPGVLERFRREAVILARLNHPAIAQLYTFFKEGGAFCMVMEFVPGETLESAIQKSGPLPWPVAFSLALQILEGISHAHSLGILHRDLKPANVILTPAGNVKLTDFGIAQALGASRLTREGRIVGTLEYLAPERIQGKPADVRSDVYSAGVMLYEMITGHLPYERDSEYELMLAQVQNPAPEPENFGIELPSATRNAVMKALEKDPDDRYPDAASFTSTLMAVQAACSPSPNSERHERLRPTRLATEPEIPSNARAEWWLRRWARLRLICTRRIVWMTAAGAVLLALAAALMNSLLHSNRTAPIDEVASVAAAPQQPAILPEPNSIPFQPIEPSAPPKGERPSPRQPSSHAPEMQPPPDTPTSPEPGAPAPTDEVRHAAISALDETDEPVSGGSGHHPIQLRGLLAALQKGGQGIIGDLAAPIAIRGVDFRPTPEAEASLRKAGATAELLRLIGLSYSTRKPATPATQPAADADRPGTETIPSPAKAIRSLSDVRSIYIEKARDGVDESIKVEIRNQLGALWKLAAAPQDADAILRVTLEAQKGGAISGAARVFGMKDRAVMRAAIIEVGSARILWQQSTGDRKPIVGAFHGESLQGMAEAIVRDLKQAVMKH